MGGGGGGIYSSEVPDLMNRVCVCVFGCSVPAEANSTARGEDVGVWVGGGGVVSLHVFVCMRTA